MYWRDKFCMQKMCYLNFFAVPSLGLKKSVLACYNAILSKSHSNPEHIAALQSKLALICYEIKDEINKSLDRKEALAVSRIKAIPKYFFSYAKSLSKLKSNISMLFTSDGNVTNNSSKMADILQNQFTSDPNAPNVKAPDFDVPSIKEQSDELGFYMTDEHAIAAITGGFSGGCGGCAPPNFIHAPPQHVLHPPNIYLHPPNIFAPYPRNYSIRGQAAYVPPNYSFLQLQTTPVLTFLMLSGTF